MSPEAQNTAQVCILLVIVALPLHLKQFLLIMYLSGRDLHGDKTLGVQPYMIETAER